MAASPLPCIIRDSRHLITTVQLQTDLYLDTEQVLPFFIRIPSSIIQLEPSIRPRSLAHW